MLWSYEPADGIYSSGDEVKMMFNEWVNIYNAPKTNIQILGIDNELTYTTKQYANEEIIFDLEDSLFDDHYMDTVRVTVYEITDKYGNEVDSQYFEFVIDNLGKSTSPVSILEPVEDFAVTLEESSVNILLTDYVIDGFEYSLDSLEVQYFRQPAGEWTTFKVFTLEELQADYATNRLTYGKPTVPVTWIPDLNVEVVDGEYSIRAVAHSSVYSNYSGTLSGTVDITRPSFLSYSGPGADSVIYSDTDVKVTYSETIDEQSVTYANVVVYQQVQGAGGSSSRAQEIVEIEVDTSYYDIEVDGEDIIITFTPLFYANYDAETIDIEIDSVHDSYGNLVEEEIELTFLVENTSQQDGVGLSIGTNLRGFYHPNGYAELIWNAPQGTQYDLFEIQRSVSGFDFRQVGDLDPDQVGHDVDEYHYLEKVNIEDKMYYRVRQVEKGTHHQYTKVVMIQGNGVVVPISSVVFPNPISGSEFNLIMTTSSMEEDVEVRLYDLSGITAAVYRIKSEDIGLGDFTFQLPDDLMSGIYSLEISQGDHVDYHKLIISR